MQCRWIGRSAIAWPSCSPLPEREGLGVGSAEALGGFLQNVCSRSVGVGDHVRIPQPDHAPAFRLEVSRPSCIRTRVGRIHVLAPVELDRQHRLAAGKIDDERCCDELPRERRAMVRESPPDRKLGRRRVVTRLACTSGQHGIDTTQHIASVARLRFARQPTPSPSLSGRGAECPQTDVRAGGRSKAAVLHSRFLIHPGP